MKSTSLLHEAKRLKCCIFLLKVYKFALALLSILCSLSQQNVITKTNSTVISANGNILKSCYE